MVWKGKIFYHVASLESDDVKEGTRCVERRNVTMSPIFFLILALFVGNFPRALERKAKQPRFGHSVTMYYFSLLQLLLAIRALAALIPAPTFETERGPVQGLQSKNLPLYSLHARTFSGSFDSFPSSPLQQPPDQHCEVCPYSCIGGECTCWRFCRTGECRKSDWGKSPLCVSTHRDSLLIGKDVGLARRRDEN